MLGRVEGKLLEPKLAVKLQKSQQEIIEEHDRKEEMLYRSVDIGEDITATAPISQTAAKSRATPI